MESSRRFLPHLIVLNKIQCVFAVFSPLARDVRPTDGSNVEDLKRGTTYPTIEKAIKQMRCGRQEANRRFAPTDCNGKGGRRQFFE